jgi:RNA polymerase sigma-70 factor, ECF subfamily
MSKHTAIHFTKVCELPIPGTLRTNFRSPEPSAAIVVSVQGFSGSPYSLSEPFALPAQKQDDTTHRAGGHEQRLRQLMTEHFDFVWRSLRRLGLPGPDADDGAQEVFLIASRKLSAIAPGSERAFLFATAVRIASTHRRSLRRRREEPDSALGEREQEQEQERSVPGPERLAEMSRARQQLQEILDGMSLEQRAIFILFELEELSVPQIASALALPNGTVSSRLRAARDYFQNAVRRLHARDAFSGGRP